MTSSRYGAEHQRIRRALLPYAAGSRCARCGKPIRPGEPVHLDHDDDHPGQYLGWSHRSCNARAGQRLGVLIKKGARFMGEISIGIEASPDRRHISIAQCGEQKRRGRVLQVVTLSHYLDREDGVVDLVAELEPFAVGVDIVGPARHLIGALQDADVNVLSPSPPEWTDSQAAFLAAVAHQEVRIAGRRELDAAVQHAHLRVSERVPRVSRQGPVDESPFHAACLALWAWGQRPSEPVIWFVESPDDYSIAMDRLTQPRGFMPRVD